MLPAALIFLVAGLVLTIRAKRSDRGRAGADPVGWVAARDRRGVLSLGQGIIHPYYTVALAPAIGALVGIGAAMWWGRRDTWPGRAVFSVVVLATGWWSYVLLQRSPTWHPWLRGAVVGMGLIAVALIVASFYRRSRLGAVAAAVTMLFVGFAGPTAYALTTASTAHAGAIPSAGPAVVGGGFGPGGRGGPAGAFRPGGVGAGGPGALGGAGGFGGPGGFGGFARRGVQGGAPPAGGVAGGGPPRWRRSTGRGRTAQRQHAHGGIDGHPQGGQRPLHLGCRCHRLQ